MAREQPPAAAVFYERVGKLKLEMERFAARNSFVRVLPVTTAVLPWTRTFMS